MVMGHNTGDARYILTGNSIEDLEKGLAEMKRQIAAGITFSVCYGGDDAKVCNQYCDACDECEFKKEYDSEYSDDDCDENCDSEYECEENDDWKVCEEEDCDDCHLMDEDEEEETEVEEEVDKNEVAAAIAQGIVAAFKDFLGM